VGSSEKMIRRLQKKKQIRRAASLSLNHCGGVNGLPSRLSIRFPSQYTLGDNELGLTDDKMV
jgi:hypothetical protein